jgi:hypothetical protein
VILAVSTVKDSPERLRRWAHRNLANGVDHLVVLVDDSDRDVLAELASTDHVTAISSSTWWGAHRPQRLNVRQRINANVVRGMGTVLPGVDWVLHLDADEVALVDRAELDAVPESTRAIRLSPCEAVSQRTWPDDEVTLFKRLLTESELAVLFALGGISKATNNEYFHGHVGGKVAMRPAEDLWLGTHHVVNADREKQPALESPWLKLLHYESHTAEEFIRKWTNLATSGGPVVTRGARADLAAAVRGLLDMDLTPELRRDVMLDLFDRHVCDDIALLDRLGLLVHLRPEEGQHRPSAPKGLVESLELLVQGLAGTDKSCFEPGGDVESARALLAPSRRGFGLRRS